MGRGGLGPYPKRWRAGFAIQEQPSHVRFMPPYTRRLVIWRERWLAGGKSLASHGPGSADWPFLREGPAVTADWHPTYSLRATAESGADGGLLRPSRNLRRYSGRRRRLGHSLANQSMGFTPPPKYAHLPAPPDAPPDHDPTAATPTASASPSPNVASPSATRCSNMPLSFACRSDGRSVRTSGGPASATAAVTPRA